MNADRSSWRNEEMSTRSDFPFYVLGNAQNMYIILQIGNNFQFTTTDCLQLCLYFGQSRSQKVFLCCLNQSISFANSYSLETLSRPYPKNHSGRTSVHWYMFGIHEKECFPSSFCSGCASTAHLFISAITWIHRLSSLPSSIIPWDNIVCCWIHAFIFSNFRLASSSDPSESTM